MGTEGEGIEEDEKDEKDEGGGKLLPSSARGEGSFLGPLIRGR
jgi:hypothetical protein